MCLMICIEMYLEFNFKERRNYDQCTFGIYAKAIAIARKGNVEEAREEHYMPTHQGQKCVEPKLFMKKLSM